MSETNVKEQPKPETVSVNDAVLQQITKSTPDDIARVSAETSARVLRLYKLFEQYAGDLSPKEQKSFALWLRDAYEREVSAGRVPDDEAIFKRVKDEFMADKKKDDDTPAQEKKDIPSPGQPSTAPSSTAPRGKVEPASSTPSTPTLVTTEEAEYYLADDDKYFAFREDRYNKMRTYKPRQPQSLTFTA